MIQTKLIHISSEDSDAAENKLNATLQEMQQKGCGIMDIREVSIKGVPHVCVMYNDFVITTPTATKTEKAPSVEEKTKESTQRYVVHSTPVEGKLMILHHIADSIPANILDGWQRGTIGDRVAGMDDQNVLIIDVQTDDFLSDKIDKYVDSTYCDGEHGVHTIRYTVHEVLEGSVNSGEKKYIPGKNVGTTLNLIDKNNISKELFDRVIAYMASCGKSPRRSINEGTLLEKVGVIRYSDGGLAGRVLDGKYIDSEAIVDITAERSEIQCTLTAAFVGIKPTLPISGFRLYTIKHSAGTEDYRLGELICTFKLHDGDKTGTETLQDVENYIVSMGKTYRERVNDDK